MVFILSLLYVMVKHFSLEPIYFIFNNKINSILILLSVQSNGSPYMTGGICAFVVFL